MRLTSVRARLLSTQYSPADDITGISELLFERGCYSEAVTLLVSVENNRDQCSTIPLCATRCIHLQEAGREPASSFHRCTWSFRLGNAAHCKGNQSLRDYVHHSEGRSH